MGHVFACFPDKSFSSGWEEPQAGQGRVDRALLGAVHCLAPFLCLSLHWLGRGAARATRGFVGMGASEVWPELSSRREKSEFKTARNQILGGLDRGCLEQPDCAPGSCRQSMVGTLTDTHRQTQLHTHSRHTELQRRASDNDPDTYAHTDRGRHKYSETHTTLMHT